MKNELKIGIIGLGYVGLPLAVEFSKYHTVTGFDISKKRIEDLKNKIDLTNEVDFTKISSLKNLKFSSDSNDLLECTIFIITVPTPIDEFKNPDLNPLKNASTLVGKYIKKGDVVIYESTVYPGCTEEICVPILEEESKRTHNKDFFTGYSPERINPGDKINTLSKIIKVTSGSNIETAIKVNNLYKTIITAGTHMASSIKVAEASKAIENAQRDLNISFMNELSLIFDRMDLDTSEVIEAASTKWNFLKFKPGLVGGHCIGVDPYYLTYKAKMLGYHSDVILSGRAINDNMAKYIADKTLLLMLKNKINAIESNVLVLGLTFKENCPDVRNSKVFDLIDILTKLDINTDLFDPLVDPTIVKRDYGYTPLIELDRNKKYDCIILATPHESKFFKDNFIKSIRAPKSIVIDVKGVLPKNSSDFRL
jgi:UDP-N-acetyl-D-galactosamine dehydrogenase